MIFGITTFKCDNCGHTFRGVAAEWCCTSITAPVQCPHCGSMHTYPAGFLSGIFGPDSIYRDIWRQYDEADKQH